MTNADEEKALIGTSHLIPQAIPFNEVYRCANPKTCPHPLHRMSIDQYKEALKMQADDGYGTVLRQRMKQSMSEPASFRPLNRVERQDPFIRFLSIASWAVGIMAVLLGLVTVWHQIVLKVIR